MQSLKQYAKYFARVKAYEKICAELKSQVILDLKRQPDGRAAVNGVEFHLTKKVEKKWARDIQAVLDNLREEIKQQQKMAEDAGKVTYKETPTFDAAIPKATVEDVLGRIPDYGKFFGLR
jgi:hypothetical protein